jgi:hypothetical protein
VEDNLPHWNPLHELERLHHIAGPCQDILEGAHRRSQMGIIHLSEPRNRKGDGHGNEKRESELKWLGYDPVRESTLLHL